MPFFYPGLSVHKISYKSLILLDHEFNGKLTNSFYFFNEFNDLNRGWALLASNLGLYIFSCSQQLGFLYFNNSALEYAFLVEESNNEQQRAYEYKQKQESLYCFTSYDVSYDQNSLSQLNTKCRIVLEEQKRRYLLKIQDTLSTPEFLEKKDLEYKKQGLFLENEPLQGVTREMSYVYDKLEKEYNVVSNLYSDILVFMKSNLKADIQRRSHYFTAKRITRYFFLKFLVGYWRYRQNFLNGFLFFGWSR